MLDDIKDPSFLRKLKTRELEKLSAEIRAFLIEKVSHTGGHLSSNLGIVELTMAVHFVFNPPLDKIIFDVGHQVYTHKILTGRKKGFDMLRKTGGLSGFSSVSESIYDVFESGHSGSAISAMVGFLLANKDNNSDSEVITIIGDASISNGTSFEALNYLGSDTEHRGIIILNDNEMSISRSVGRFARVLTSLRGSSFLRALKKVLQFIFPKIIHRIFGRLKRSLKGILQRQNIFEDLGYIYIGPIDGHDIKSLIYNLKKAKDMRKSVVVHVITTKGKGYKPAENDPSRFHGTDSFNIEDGSSNNNSNTEISYSEAISNELYNLQKEVKTYVVMPAMTVGSKFRKFQIDYQDRYLDVGIAEEHAATLAGSLSLNKMKVILSFYAVFSQRAFDQILNEIARPNHHVVILLDRAGLVSEDGSTHQGIYDIPMFNMMPNMVILSPYSISEVKAMVRYAVLKCDTPVVIRYPKASLINNCTDDNIEFDSKWKFIIKENDSKICIISYGECLNYLNEIILDNDLNISLVNARIVKPIDADFLEMLFLEYKHIVVYEETVLEGSLYSVICTYGAKTKIYGMNITNKVIPHGALEDLRKYCGLDSKKVIELVNKIKEEAC